MDANRFSDWTQAIAARLHSRRSSLGMLGGAALAFLSTSAAAADDGGCKQRCDGKCIPKRDCCVEGKHLLRRETYRQCGVCIAGEVRPRQWLCTRLLPDDCIECHAQTFRCGPGVA